MQSRAYYVVFNMSLSRYCSRKRLKRNSKKSFSHSVLLVQHFLIMWYLFLLFSFLNVILSSLSVSGQPFATVSSSCADKLTVRSSSSGIIFSNRDGAYAHDVNCSWSIFSSTNVELVFFRFDTEENHDYIYVYDGGSMMSSLIGKYHGNSLPAVITSSSNQLYVTFSSDTKVSSTGFAASYHGKTSLQNFSEFVYSCNYCKSK